MIDYGSVKVCRECKHFAEISRGRSNPYRCTRQPAEKFINEVTGDKRTVFPACEDERSPDGNCKRAGILWEAKT